LKNAAISDAALGRFIKGYVQMPEAVFCDSRSSIREDAVIREISRLLAENQSPICIVDACCGMAGLPRRIISSIGGDVARINYVAIERDSACIDMIKTSPEEFSAFASFRPLLRDVCDLDGLHIDEAHLIILNNVAHEIPPHHYIDLLSCLNKLLHKGSGRLCIIDMEELPGDSPEAIAINWSMKELVEILKSGGFHPEPSLHEKAVNVYQIHVRHIENVNRNAMLQAIRTCVANKLELAIRKRRKLEASFASGHENYEAWVVATGSLARLADEAAALQQIRD
jgi:hypothetical protein